MSERGDRQLERSVSPASAPAGLPGTEEGKARARIVEVATRLFRERGYEPTSVADISEAAEVAPATFYLYFDSKAAVALANFDQWISDLAGALEQRPAGETSDQLLVGALDALRLQGYVSSERLRDEHGHALAPVGMAALLGDTVPDVAGRVYLGLMELQRRLTTLFRERLGYPPGSLRPRIIAAGFIASWFVAAHGFAELLFLDPDPPAPDDLAIESFQTYVDGLRPLWQ
jgi:TetR/AcrR family transcriptional regulator, regulator of mycofactocin system